MNQPVVSQPDGVAQDSVQLAFAFVHGEAVTELPQDLYIPPDALEVILESFEGPLDLLLYLIRKQNLDILNIDVSAITEQYMKYIDVMQSMRFELAAEYLLMAATLAEIKSRMLLPRRQQDEDGEEIDPRMELIRRLQEYERFKTAAEDLDELPRLDRDFFIVEVKPPRVDRQTVHPDVSLQELLYSLKEVLQRSDMFEHHQIEKEKLSTRERMTQVLARLTPDQYVSFTELFVPEEGRLGIIVTFMAIMELIKEQLVDLIQTEPFAPIHLKAKA
jgi:segregation and condensation protein A